MQKLQCAASFASKKVNASQKYLLLENNLWANLYTPTNCQNINWSPKLDTYQTWLCCYSINYYVSILLRMFIRSGVKELIELKLRFSNQLFFCLLTQIYLTVFWTLNLEICLAFVYNFHRIILGILISNVVVKYFFYLKQECGRTASGFTKIKRYLRYFCYDDQL